jgi:hypothetical protein
MSKCLMVFLGLFLSLQFATADSSQSVLSVNCFSPSGSPSQTITFFLGGNVETTTWTDSSSNSIPAQTYWEAGVTVKSESSVGDIALKGYFESASDLPSSGSNASFRQNGATIYVLREQSAGMSSNGPAQLTVLLTVPDSGSSALNVSSSGFDASTGAGVTTQITNITNLNCLAASPANFYQLAEAKTLLKP